MHSARPCVASFITRVGEGGADARLAALLAAGVHVGQPDHHRRNDRGQQDLQPRRQGQQQQGGLWVDVKGWCGLGLSGRKASSQQTLMKSNRIDRSTDPYLGLVPRGRRGRERLHHVGEEQRGLENVVDEAREGADGRGVEDAGLGGRDADAAARHQVQDRAGAVGRG